MTLKPPPDSIFKRTVLKILDYIEWLGLFIITIATLIAIGQEVYSIFSNGRVLLEDILLLFIFLEILTMVSLYFSTGKLPLRYPIYIAIVAIARYITISMKEMDGMTIMLLSLAMLILSLAVISIRYGHLHLPYGDKE
ncbi:phosphate-starvation-inducible PsiE family protein [Candidatus Albibeggiatoa sp. nov. NOAA]|uniref:phosphate-starvation-inducible protein PsiE n=1 Tax=Candidatus Albibeggiatoa sp. nov. NOAA TaxID=3162724 RepID=UPI0033015AD5|nr:phosphate-starvation-inducible PsiE family protein [Thiotrichaceae bacterium]